MSENNQKQLINESSVLTAKMLEHAKGQRLSVVELSIATMIELLQRHANLSMDNVNHYVKVLKQTHDEKEANGEFTGSVTLHQVNPDEQGEN